MKKIFALILSLCMLTLCLSSCKNSAEGELDHVKTTDTQTDYVLLEVEDYGKILIRLFPDVAPETVKNFKKLVSENFYDGIIFHRVIENFMIQGGDPDGNGMGGSDKTITGEFTSNGFTNNLLHVRGTVSMARTDDPNSASSQFFIMHKTTSSLDGDYAAFGHVIKGMTVVDAIASVYTDTNNKPTKDVVIKSIRFVDPSSIEVDTSVSSDIFEESKEKETLSEYLDFEQIDLSEISSLDNVSKAVDKTNYVMLDIEDYGKVVIRLFPEVAPITVANFKELVDDGFYDGLTFHRIIENFMIQGGNPEGDGSGGSDEEIYGEFTSNGFENNLEHIRGVVSMARSNDPDSASSQFFIVHKDSPHLNGSYAAFGYVVYGMDVVDEIAATDTYSDDQPIQKVTISSATFVNVALDK